MQAGSSPEILKLHGSLTVVRASSLKTEIAEALSTGENVLLNLSQVEDLDLSCLQVLCAAMLSASKAGKELHFGGSLPSKVSQRLVACGILQGDSEHAEDFESALASS
jgi:anti-anti-sigma regulatory factor